jgi:hypothetical protein
MMSDFLKVLYRRAFAGRDPALLQLSFDPAVLDRYRGNSAFQVIRTNTAGRVKKQGAWALDFGIAEDDAFIHASWAALINSLPDDEREHWAMHAMWQAASNNFLRMQLSPGSCFDDGELRTW